MTYSSSSIVDPFGTDGEYVPPSAEELLEQQTAHLRKLWVGCYLLSHRLHGGGHSTQTDLETIRTEFLAENQTAVESQASCYAILEALQTEAASLIDGGDWSAATQYSLEARIPGPFADDAAADAGGVAVGALYKVDGGAVAWRVS